MMVYIFNAPYRQHMHVNVNEYNLLVEIQTLCYSAVVYEEDEQIKHRWLPGPRTAAEGSPVWKRKGSETLQLVQDEECMYFQNRMNTSPA